MVAEELAKKLVDTGFIGQEDLRHATTILRESIEKKGEDAVTKKVNGRLYCRPRSPLRTLSLMMGDIPDLPPSERPMTIEEELKSEREDMEKASQLLKHLGREFSEPWDKRWEKHPSVFDGPYYGHEEYKSNTYISVYREAKQENTSMHEICRRKNLSYEHLIQ